MVHSERPTFSLPNSYGYTEPSGQGYRRKAGQERNSRVSFLLQALGNTNDKQQYLSTARTHVNPGQLPTHDNPAPVFRQIERILRVFFPDCGENIKIAILLNVLPERKYKSVVDTLETSQNRVGYSELKDMIIRYWMRQQSTYEGKAKGNASAYGADTGRVSRNRPRWCPTYIGQCPL